MFKVTFNDLVMVLVDTLDPRELIQRWRKRG